MLKHSQVGRCPIGSITPPPLQSRGASCGAPPCSPSLASEFVAYARPRGSLCRVHIVRIQGACSGQHAPCKLFLGHSGSKVQRNNESMRCVPQEGIHCRAHWRATPHLGHRSVDYHLLSSVIVRSFDTPHCRCQGYLEEADGSTVSEDVLESSIRHSFARAGLEWIA